MSYKSLISVDALAAQHADYLIIDCRFNLADTHQGEQQYLQAHLPGARYAHLDKHLSSPITANSGRHPLPDFDTLIEQFRLWGVSNDTRVVVYDDAGGIYASRLWWLLRALGHDTVAVLEGGIQAWKAAGNALVSDQPVSARGNFTPALKRNSWWDVDELQRHLMAKDCVLIDARSKERFEGAAEPIDPVAGRIPGSVNLFIADNLDANGFFIDSTILRKNYQKVIENTDPTQVIHSCGSGVFACFGVLCMEVAGLEGSKLYPGSWSEWIRDPGRQVMTG